MASKVLDHPGAHRFRWIVIAFLSAGAVMTGLLTWQLFESTPARWCAVSIQGSPDMATGCFNVLMHLLDIKDHAIIGLLGIVGLSVLALAVVALGVKVGAAGPGGFTANIESDKTTIAAGEASVIIPTPPSDDK